MSAKEILASFKALMASAKNYNNETIYGLTIYYNRIIQDSNLIYKKSLNLAQTQRLCEEGLAKYIILNSDSTIYFTTNDYGPSFFKTYEHCICYVPNGKKVNLDLSNISRIIRSEGITSNWIYLVIEHDSND
jgi:hypothetical protein